MRRRAAPYLHDEYDRLIEFGGRRGGGRLFSEAGAPIGAPKVYGGPLGYPETIDFVGGPGRTRTSNQAVMSRAGLVQKGYVRISIGK